jgi:hypothetical protein
MTNLTVLHDAAPYESDAERLEDEVSWVRARCRHLGAKVEAEREADKAEAEEPAVRGNGTSTNGNGRKVARLAAAQATIRRKIDARVAVTEVAGRVHALDRVRREHDLAEVEFQVLVLATIPTIGMDMYDTLGQLASFGFATMSICPELIALFGDLDLAARIRLRHQLGERGKLVAAGLIHVGTAGERVQDFWNAGVFLTDEGYRQIVDPLLPEEDVRSL